jgi:hypothetical protein
MSDAAASQNGRRGYQKHGDSYRQRLLKERGVAAIDGRSRSGKQAKDWRRYALQRKGGKTCPIDVREKIEAGCFYLWRARASRLYRRRCPDARHSVNKRERTLPAINAQYDTAMEQWQRINDKLQLDRGLDLARRLMVDD